MGAALQATGRPIVYSLCEYGRFDVGTWGRKVGASARLSAPWSQLGLTAPPASVRDLWKQVDLQSAGDAVAAEIPAHGVALFKLGQAKHGATPHNP